MMKTGATAMLAIATLAGSAAAQDTCAPLWAQCLGPEAADNRPCCSGDGEAVACVQKNDQYAQCRPASESGTNAPLGWMGNALDTPSTAGASADADDSTEAEAEDEDEAVEPATGPIMDAEDVVEMGLAPPGMDAKDVEEMGMTEDLAKELDENAEVVEMTTDDEEHEDGEHVHEDGEEHEHDDEDAEVEADAEDVAAAKDGVEDDEDEEQVLTVPAGETMAEAVAAAAAGPAAETPAETPVQAPVEGPVEAVVDAGADKEAIIQFINFPGFDYIPNGSNLVEVQDLVPSSMGSMKVANPQACEDFCSATEGCNAASYYLDGSAYGDKNCWLKTIGNACERPKDAMVDPNAVLILLLDDTCEAALAAIAERDAVAPAGLADDAMAPVSDLEDGAVADDAGTADTTGTRSLGDDATGDDGSSSDGVVSVRGALIAMAVAGAAALF